MNYVMRFENLQEDFNAVCEKIAIPKQELPHVNKSTHKEYTEYYDDELRALVAKLYRKDFELFEYEWEDVPEK